MSDIYSGCLFFANDILLLFVSVCKLRTMVDLCITFASAVDLKFNHDKSHVFQTGLSCNLVLKNSYLGNNVLQWINELKYLGVVFLSGK
jgi:hypothetical protein